MLPDVLLEIAATLELFQTATGVAFADLRIAGHRETWPVRSRRLRGWLRRRYYEETGEALAAAAVRSALDLLEARAQFDAPERSVHVRVLTWILQDGVRNFLVWAISRERGMIPNW